VQPPASLGNQDWMAKNLSYKELLSNLNGLKAVAINEGLCSKKRLWRESGREQLETFRLAPWASRRREDLLKLLDGLHWRSC
jgi:hypothetical protein